MVTTVFQMGENFQPHDVIAWYLEASLGEAITVKLPGRFAALQLICCDNGDLHWWPEGGRGVTLPLDNAVARLSMLQEVRSRNVGQYARHVQQVLCP